MPLPQVDEAAYAREHQWLPERERGLQHARLIDLAIRQRDDVGAPEESRDLLVGHEARHEANTFAGAPSALLKLVERKVRQADDPQLRVLDSLECLEQHIEPLVGAEKAEEEHHRPVHGRQLSGQRSLGREAREVVERAVRDHVEPLSGYAQLLA
jgi:hypothetical protein